MAISRRSFLKSSAAAAAVTMAAGATKMVLAEATATTFSPGPGNKWPGKVVVNFNKDAVTSTTTIGDEQIKIIKQMIDDSIKALSGKATVGEAWKAIFPDSLTKDSLITIKTNFYATSACRPHWSAVQAMTEGLQKMDFSGTTFPAANITIFEGAVPVANTMDGAGYTAARFPGITRIVDTFDKNVTDAAKGETNGYATSLKKANFFISVFGLRGHSNDYAEGVTLGGKNHYGTYSNATPAHTSPALSVRCANMMCTGVVYNKLVLSVCVGLLSNKKGAGINDGPTDYSVYAKKIDPTSTTKATSTIIMSTDPISAEMQAVKVMQINAGKTWGVSDMPKYLQASAGISGALSGASYNIGKIDENEMTLLKIINGDSTTPIKSVNNQAHATGDYLLRVSSLNRQHLLHIEYSVPAMRRGDHSVLTIYDLLGNLLFSQEQEIQGVLNHFSWDARMSNGKILRCGKYVCKLTIGRISRSAEFAVI